MTSRVLGEFADLFPFCAICWSRRDLEIHHIVGGSARTHERINLLRLCRRCHSSLHSYGGRDCVEPGHCLVAKREQDPENFSTVGLAGLRHRVGLPYGPAALPEWVYAERRRNGVPQEYVMPINSRSKGKRGELEAAAELNRVLPHAHARRACQYSGTETASDVVAPGLKGLWLEVKRVERLNLHDVMEKSVEQCGDLAPVIMHRRNGKEWLVTIRLDDVPRFARGVS